jgi:hypothetical protein
MKSSLEHGDRERTGTAVCKSDIKEFYNIM